MNIIIQEIEAKWVFVSFVWEREKYTLIRESHAQCVRVGMSDFPPELTSGKLSDKSDVYSYGVVWTNYKNITLIYLILTFNFSISSKIITNNFGIMISWA